jgi:hypothetical protein
VLTGSSDKTAKIWDLWAQTNAIGVKNIGDVNKFIADYTKAKFYKDEKYLLEENDSFKNTPTLLFSNIIGRSMIDILAEADDMENIEWCTKRALRSLLNPLEFAEYKENRHCTIMEYFISHRNTRLCKYFSQVYSELLWPPSALVKSQRVLNEDLAPHYDVSIPMCDLIDVRDLVSLGKTYPALLVQIVQKLEALPHDKKIVDKWMRPIRRLEVRGSSECYPYGFWNTTDDPPLQPNAIEIAVEASILPLRNVASLEHDFLGEVFRAAKGDPKPFESGFLEVLVDFKWRTYVRRVFILDFMLYALMTAAYVAHSMWFITYSALPQGNAEKSMGIALYVFVLSLHLYFVRHEVKQLKYEIDQAYDDKKAFYIIAGAARHLRDPWNLQDLFRLMLVSVAMMYYFVLLVNSTDGHMDPTGLRFVSTMSAVAIPTFALGFLFYLQAMKGYGALVRMIFKIIESTKAFLAVLVILTFGYSASFNLMTLTDYSSAIVGDENWNTYSNALLSSTLLVMGVDVEISAITDAEYKIISVTLLVSFMLLMGVILLNLLIAIMSDKHSEVKKQERASAIYNRACIVVEYEKLMSSTDRLKKEYSPTYLQVLQLEKVAEGEDRSEEIRALEQLVHNKTNEIKEDLKDETASLREMLSAQAKDSETLKSEIKIENEIMKKNLKEENVELRRMLESQMQSTSELKELLTKVLLENKQFQVATVAETEAASDVTA